MDFFAEDYDSDKNILFRVKNDHEKNSAAKHIKHNKQRCSFSKAEEEEIILKIRKNDKKIFKVYYPERKNLPRSEDKLKNNFPNNPFP